MPARVIILAGPSGTGKSRLAARVGLPVLRLDDFYKDGDDPTLPRITHGANEGLVDWDDPRSWLADEAVATIEKLCADGSAEVPTYEISANGRTGSHLLELDGADLFVAEGIFAQEIVTAVRERGVLAEALVLQQHPVVTFWRRLVRDLREHRKPPLVLLRRGVVLMREQREVIAHAVDLGCRAVTPDAAARLISAQRTTR